MPDPDGDTSPVVRDAVHDVVDSYRPASRPPLHVLVLRRRRRDGLRALGATAAALTVAGTVLLTADTRPRTELASPPTLISAGSTNGPASTAPRASGPAQNALGPPLVRSVLSVRFGPGTYRDAVSDDAVGACSRLPGVAKETLMLESYPPQFVLPFTGTSAQREQVRRCLQAVDGTQVSERVSEPTPAVPDATTGPTEPAHPQAEPNSGTVRLLTPAQVGAARTVTALRQGDTLVYADVNGEVIRAKACLRTGCRF